VIVVDDGSTDSTSSVAESKGVRVLRHNKNKGVGAARDYKPFQLFLVISVLFFLMGLALAIFLGIHYMRTGMFSPHKWAGFTSAFFFIISFLNLLL